MKKRNRNLLTAAAVLAGIHSAGAGSFVANFDDGLTPAGSTLYGNGSTAGVIQTTGGVNNTGCLVLTKNVNSLQGAWILNDLDAGAQVNGFTANFKLRIGGGTNPPADGCSFCVASDLPAASFGEGGAGSGLRVGFDVYSPSEITVTWNNVRIATTAIPIATLATNTFVDVMVRINPTGTLDLTYNGSAIHTGLNIGYRPITGARYGFGGRTGGLNVNSFVDNLSIATTTGELTPLITRQPLPLRMATGYSALFNVQTNGAAGVVYQWQQKRPGDLDFSDITGASAIEFQTPALSLADSGTQYRVVLTGNGTTVTSNPAAVEVVHLAHGTPTASFNFNDGQVPAGSGAFGTAAVQPSGGWNNTGFMVLTENINSQAGTWTANDLNGGLPVESIDVNYKLRMSDGTAVPADGFGFHWAPDLPDAGFPSAEEPVGTGLSVVFDVYDNTDGNPNNLPAGEAPAIDVFWLRQRVGGTVVPLEFLNTKGAFQDVSIRLSNEGKIDVMFNGIVLVYQLQVPNWTSFSGARYGFSARTGGLNQKHYIDEVTIQSTPYAGPIGFITHPQNASALPGYNASFSVASNDPGRAIYQWQSKAPGAAAFTDISGANAPSYTGGPFTLAESGTQFRCHISRLSPASAADSNPATLTLVDLARPESPQVLYTFDDEAVTPPTNFGSVSGANATISGAPSAAVLPDVGADGSAALRLTEAANSQFGTLVIDDFNGGLAVSGFTAAIKVAITGANPADGWSLSWSDNIAQTQVYGGLENGVGDDLKIGFITYAGSGVGVKVVVGDTQIAKALVPLELLQTAGGTVFEDVRIRFVPDASGIGGKIDVAQDGVMIFNGLAVPSIRALSGARFALAARTGGANEAHVIDDVAIQTTLTPFAQWQASNFGGTPDPAVAGPGADPDNDSLTNLDEYGFGFDDLGRPLDPVSGGAVTLKPVFEGGNLAITFPRTRNGGVAHVVEWSDDLAAWSTAGVVESVVDNSKPGYQVVRGSVPAPGSRRHIRVRFVQP